MCFQCGWLCGMVGWKGGLAWIYKVTFLKAVECVGPIDNVSSVVFVVLPVCLILCPCVLDY